MPRIQYVYYTVIYEGFQFFAAKITHIFLEAKNHICSDFETVLFPIAIISSLNEYLTSRQNLSNLKFGANMILIRFQNSWVTVQSLVMNRKTLVL